MITDESRLELLLHQSWHEAGIPFTEVLAFGRRITWPGRFDDVSTILRKAGFSLGEQRGHHGTTLVITTGPRGAPPFDPEPAAPSTDEAETPQLIGEGRALQTEPGRGVWSCVVRGTFRSARDVHDRVV
jgi:hypothetical protein